MKIVKISQKIKTPEGSRWTESIYVIKRKGFRHTVTWISDGIAIPVVGVDSIMSTDPEVDTETLTEKAEEARDAMREDGETNK